MKKLIVLAAAAMIGVGFSAIAEDAPPTPPAAPAAPAPAKKEMGKKGGKKHGKKKDGAAK